MALTSFQLHQQKQRLKIARMKASTWALTHKNVYSLKDERLLAMMLLVDTSNRNPEVCLQRREILESEMKLRGFTDAQTVACRPAAVRKVSDLSEAAIQQTREVTAARFAQFASEVDSSPVLSSCSNGPPGRLKNDADLLRDYEAICKKALDPAISGKERKSTTTRRTHHLNEIVKRGLPHVHWSTLK